MHVCMIFWQFDLYDSQIYMHFHLNRQKAYVLYITGMDAVEQAVAMKNELLDMLNEVGEKLPPNTLDHLIDELGGTESVAEMTGRKGRVVNTDEGITYESRSEVDVPLEILNLTEKQRFMDGEKVLTWFFSPLLWNTKVYSLFCFFRQIRLYIFMVL